MQLSFQLNIFLSTCLQNKLPSSAKTDNSDFASFSVSLFDPIWFYFLKHHLDPIWFDFLKHIIGRLLSGQKTRSLSINIGNEHYLWASQKIPWSWNNWSQPQVFPRMLSHCGFIQICKATSIYIQRIQSQLAGSERRYSSEKKTNLWHIWETKIRRKDKYAVQSYKNITPNTKYTWDLIVRGTIVQFSRQKHHYHFPMQSSEPYPKPWGGQKSQKRERERRRKGFLLFSKRLGADWVCCLGQGKEIDLTEHNLW